MMLLGSRSGLESVLGMKPLFLSHSVQHFSVKKIYWNSQIIFAKLLREFYVWQFNGKLFIRLVKERRK